MISRLLLYGGGAVVLALFLLLGIAKMDARHWHKQSDQNAALAQNYKAQLDRISSEKQAQKIVTQTKIETVTKLIKVVADKAKVVEQAPLPGQCRTPKEVLDADI
jgi:Tfp pilus assembly protein PilN